MDIHSPASVYLRNFRFVLLFFTCLLSITGYSQALAENSRMNTDIEAIAERYGALPERQLMSISPNGKRIAFRMKEDDQDMVIVYSMAKSKVVTGANVNNLQPHYLHFISDDQLIMVASQVKSLFRYRGEHSISTAYVLNIKTGDIKQLLTPGDRIMLGQKGLGRIAGISRDKKYLYMPALTDNGSTALMKVNVKVPRHPAIADRGHADTLNYFLNAQSEVIAKERYDNKRDIYSILVPDGWGLKTLYEHKTPILDAWVAGMTPERDYLIFMKENDETGIHSYHRLSLSTGEVTPLDTQKADADIGGALVNAAQIVEGIRYQGFTPSYELFDSEQNKRLQSLQAMFEGDAVRLVDWSEDWRHLIIYVEGPGSSGEYYLATQGKPLQYLAASRPQIPPEDIQPISQITLKARDGLTLPTLLTIPLARAQSPKDLPTVMLPHGGPHAHDQIGFDWLAQALARRGYLVVQPQFRGSTGFGKEHRQAGLGEWGGKMQDDITDSLLALSKAGLVDPDRVCILGGSYGGYASLAGAAFTPEHYRCAIALNGVFDLARMLKETRWDRGSDHWVLDYWKDSMGGDNFDQSHLEKISPALHAERVSAPVLLLHGEQDEVVPIKQSKIMQSQLDKAGKPVEFVELKDENHYLMQGESRVVVLRHILGFLDEHLGETDRPATQANTASAM